MKKILQNHNLYAAITILFWSLAYLFTRRVVNVFSPYGAGLLRYLVASIVLIPVLILAKTKKPRLKDIPAFAVSGFVGFFLYMVFFNTSATMMTGATCSILIATTPIMTALLAVVFYKEKLKGYQWFAFLISFSGILVLFLFDNTISGGIGIFWGLCAAFVLAVYNIWQKRLNKYYSGLEIAAYSIFAGTICLSMFTPIVIREWSAVTPAVLGSMAFLGVFSSAVAYVSWSKALALAKRTSDVSNYMFITPFLTTIVGIIGANEIPSVSTVVGGILIISGLLLFQKEHLVHRK